MRRSKPQFGTPQWMTEREDLLVFAERKGEGTKTLAEQHGYEWQEVLDMRAALEVQKDSMTRPFGVLTLSSCLEIVKIVRTAMKES